jgi:plastocyanin domain-containing protein
MNAADWIVITAGAAGIAWVNWYFFVAGRSASISVASASGAAPTSTPEIVITVDGGYDPKTVRVPAGKAVRLVFDRRDNSSCSEEIVFPDFGIRRFLPTGERTTIEVTPPAVGKYEFMCGMSMLRGALIAE